MGLFIQAYDRHGVVVAHSRAANEDEAQRKFIAMCCDTNSIVDRIDVFMDGDPEALIWAYRNQRSMRSLIMDKMWLSASVH